MAAVGKLRRSELCAHITIRRAKFKEGGGARTPLDEVPYQFKIRLHIHFYLNALRRITMKKLSIVALAALMVVAFSMPAAALENTFGGNNWTSFATVSDIDGNDLTNNDSNSDIHSRTRLYYTAGINDNLKFVTKFEFDADWGQAGTHGAPGADAVAVEIKNAYADINFGAVNVKMGTQGMGLARGMLWSDDLSGLVVTYSLSDTITIPFTWVKLFENSTAAPGVNEEEQDVDVYALTPVFKIGEGISLQPMIVNAKADDISFYGFGTAAAAGTEMDAWFYGIDASAAFGPVSVFGVYIMQSGEFTPTGAASVDLSGYALNAGASFDMGMFSIRGEVLMYSGDSNLADNDVESFTSTPRESIDTGEIITANGTFFQHAPGVYDAGSPATSTFLAASNGLTVYNIGASVAPMDKLSLKLDYYDASYAETAAGASDDIGSEIDFQVTYQLLEGLSLDVIAAFFQTGEGLVAANEEDITMYGAQFTVAW
jgi:hypothetical protein